ncbi:MAG: 4-hydroxy-tetrahydrodipicolinate reductase [Bacteroidales bacterium]|nr:4-hydroxy-tetrahydrodipicolinate reductase [Bacteroidales bacterium]
MKIALIGYGKMGHEVETVALNRNHQVILKIDKDNENDLTPQNLKEIDVAIEFSTPTTAYRNVRKCLESNIPVVVGTTGWLDKLDDAKLVADNCNTALFHASNYSIGVNIFFRLNKVLADYINNVKGYSLSITETHHTQKLDAPSGTAITLAQLIAESIDELNGWTLLPNKSNGKIPIEAIREGDVPGTHTVTFNSEQDEILLTHRAKSRKGFAVGAVLAAEFLVGKKGFFTMEDLLRF